MKLEDESCFKSITRMYCYLRRIGMEPHQACRQLQVLLPAILAADGDINPALILLHTTGDTLPNACIPRPAPVPALLRGHIGYRSPAG